MPVRLPKAVGPPARARAIQVSGASPSATMRSLTIESRTDIRRSQRRRQPLQHELRLKALIELPLRMNAGGIDLRSGQQRLRVGGKRVSQAGNIELAIASSFVRQR